MKSILQKKDRYFNQIFKISLLVSLAIFTLVFLLFPRFSQNTIIREQPIKIEIYVSSIPQTRQPSPLARPPSRPSGMIPIHSEEPDLPMEIELPSPGTAHISQELGAMLSPETPAKPILEVYPTVSGVTCKGYVRLLLLIDKEGNTESLEVLENTSTADTCLFLVIEAARKSRWLPAQLDGHPVSSWVTKTYKFNPKD